MRVDWRRVLVVELALLAGCALAVVAWWVVSRFSHTVFLLLTGAIVAFALEPAVGRLEERLGGRRGMAALIVYLAVLVAAVGGLALLVVPLVGQTTALIGDLPAIADALKAQLPGLETRLRGMGLPVEAGALQARASAWVVESGGGVLGVTLTLLTGVAGGFVDLLLSLVVSLYLVLEGPRLREALAALVPAGRRAEALFVEETVVRIAGGYLRGQLVLALVMGVLAGLGAWLFGLRYPHVVGLVAGVLEVVPMVGPILGAVPAILLALLLPFPTVVWVILYFVAIQQFENYVLVPRVSGHAVGLHPLAAMMALVAGFEVAGILGALVSVPVAGVLWALGSAAVRRLRYGDAEPPPPRRRGPLLLRRGVTGGTRTPDPPAPIPPAGR
jgi:predicted PurR-regulated permease PerM